MFRRLAVASVAVGVIGCGGDGRVPSAPSDDDITGQYSLSTVNGQDLPYLMDEQEAYKIELTGDFVTLAASGSFTQMTRVRVTEGGVATTEYRPDAGTWTRSGTAITVRFQSKGRTVTGSFDGNGITVALDGLSYV